jgi:CRISPR-associated protein Cas1
MLNEFVYCPRLFYYEHVEGLFLHNADTLSGKALHSKVDTPGGNLPSPSPSTSSPTSSPAPSDTQNQDAPLPSKNAANAPPETIHARSVSLSDETLGVIAKLDLVEGETAPDGTLRVAPVEYKRGTPREADDGNTLWDADRIQLGLQILLLRANGYACDHGIVFYRATRQRIRYELTPADIAWIYQKIDAARAACDAPIPPPLADSPKCPRCSLAPICLPDESRLLARLADADSPPPPTQLELNLHLDTPPNTALDETTKQKNTVSTGTEQNSPHSSAPAFPIPVAAFPDFKIPKITAPDNLRRLIAPNDETRALYLISPGSYVTQKHETIIVTNRNDNALPPLLDGIPAPPKKDDFRLLDLHHIALFGAVQMSTGVIQRCCDNNIPIVYFSSGGFFYGITRGNALPNVRARIAQFATAADPARSIAIARNLIYGKIRNQRTHLQRNHVEPSAATLHALKYCAANALVSNDLYSLLGIEGTAAHCYFENFTGMLRTGDEHNDAHNKSTGNATTTAQKEFPFAFAFGGRNRRPPRDPVNAVLSFLYAMLAKDATVACLACGLDPYVGFLHQPRHGKPALALDLMEEFRPIIADSVALTLFNKRQLKQNDFITTGKAVALKDTSRQTIIMAYERRLKDAITHPVFNYKVSYRRAIELQARLLSKVLTEEIPQYIPFMTR